MTVITDYASLIQTIKDITEDDSSELSSYIPTAISLAEDRLVQELDLPELEAGYTGTCSTSSPYITKPMTKDMGITSVFVTSTDGKRTLLTRKTIDFLYDYWPKASVTSFPKYYTVYDTTRLYLAPTPASNYAYEVRAFSVPTKLSSSNTTNYFTNNTCSQALLYATMVNISIFMKAWSQVDSWGGLYQTAASDWNYQAQRQRRDSNSTFSNPSTSQNTLKHTVGTGSTA